MIVQYTMSDAGSLRKGNSAYQLHARALIYIYTIQKTAGNQYGCTGQYCLMSTCLMLNMHNAFLMQPFLAETIAYQGTVMIIYRVNTILILNHITGGTVFQSCKQLSAIRKNTESGIRKLCGKRQSVFII